jgi:regulation of enolase protein 1 (concanavalin A-like superfamily)
MCKKLIYFICFVLVLGLTAGSANAQIGQGHILFEYYWGGGINDRLAQTYGNPKWPDGWDNWEWRTSFVGPTNIGDSYATRVHGYLYPPADGSYTFWISSDNESELFLSTDDNPANIVMIATVMGTGTEGWTNPLEWSKYAAQKSVVITLEAGKRYYVEVAATEGGGGDNLAVGWGGPVIGTGPVVIEGQYLSPWIRDMDNLASEPNPADGAPAVMEKLLKWKAGVTAEWHEIYFGTTSDLGTANLVLRFPKSTTEYNYPKDFIPGQRYYWRVDEIEADKVTIHTGKLWSFTAAPATANTPTPKSGMRWVDVNTSLEWRPGINNKSHDVYFGLNAADVAAGTGGTFKGNQLTTTFNPGPLAETTTYYWKIDEHTDTEMYPGELWSFTTIASGGLGAKAEYFGNMNLEGNPILTRIEDSIDHRWEWDVEVLPGISDNISARWTADLEFAFTEPMTLITTSEDGVRLYVDGQLVIDNWTMHTATEDTYTFDVVAGQIVNIVMEWYEAAGNAVIKLSWQSPSTPKQIIPPGPLQMPRRAGSPIPANGEVNVKHNIKLRWTSGDDALQHDVYFGTNENDVRNATTTTVDIYKGRQDLGQTSYIPGTLDWNTTYYWRIDEIGSAKTWKGSVWSFTVANFIVVDDFEDYNDVNNLIYDTWTDYFVNNTGMTVGHYDPPFAERDIVHSGRQAMYMRYDNDGTVNEGTSYERSGTLLYSEAERQWQDPQDWTAHGAESLTLWFRGIPGPLGSFTLGPPIKMTAIGTDIAGTADQFHYAYKRLSGNGAITAKVLSVSNTNALAKAGVMMRESLDAGSKNFATVASPSNRVSFVRRTTTDGTAASTTRTGATIPQWVRITRSGNTFTAQYSANGTTWTAVGTPQEIQMPIDVYVGLCVTSRNANAICTAEFSDVSITGTGTVTGDWKSQDVGIKNNAPEQLYVAVTDSADKIAFVRHQDPTSTTISTWTQWDIPLSAFTSVNLQSINKLTIGVGDRASTQPGGAGDLYIDDIELKLP